MAKARNDGKGPRCPFHGMIGNRHGIMSGGPSGNACGLTLAHAPCRLEMEGDRPDWDACHVFGHPDHQTLIAPIVDGFRAYPDSQRPEGASSWSGLSVREWFARVMGRAYDDRGLQN